MASQIDAAREGIIYFTRQDNLVVLDTISNQSPPVGYFLFWEKKKERKYEYFLWKKL